ncbi:hypothetical protein NA57DRAFT_70215 [Rhizodiscina lignyota]|uniref:Ph domain-containing protein n=1 Tax=Rhizodiscina lignyota TaxID=1504668 RepID=A0A9P4IRF1_9PEZI|nr:hypothetical protein NA57DRAFT_70215 [Rhizodiscina lignyota]
MAQAVGKYAAKKLLSSELKKHQSREPGGQYDPYYTYIEDPRRPGKKKKVKKQIPDYLPDNDAMILAKVRKRAYMLDCSLFNFLGQRFGWSSVIGLFPFAGDGADGAIAFLWVYYACTKVTGGLPLSVHVMMLLNIALDFVVGLVPFLGDLLDAAFKANSRNVRELEKLLDKRYKPKELSEKEARVRREKRASGMRYESPPPATVLEDMDDQEVYPLDVQESGVARPTPSAARPERGGGPAPDRQQSKRSGGGWFSGGSRRERRPDIEMGR